jgi:hypothetical protein
MFFLSFDLYLRITPPFFFLCIFKFSYTTSKISHNEEESKIWYTINIDIVVSVGLKSETPIFLFTCKWVGCNIGISFMFCNKNFVLTVLAVDIFFY